MIDSDKLLDDYANIIDCCIEGVHIPVMFSGDPICEYISNIVNSYRDYLNDSIFMGLLIENLMEFLRKLLPPIIEVRNRYLRLMNKLKAGQNDKSKIRPLTEELDSKCIEEQIVIINEILSSRYKNGSGMWVSVRDYEERSRVKDIVYDYPILKEILELLGHQNESNNLTHEHILTHFNPILLDHSSEHTQVDGVRMGNDLSNLLPMEYALIDQPLFYVRYVKHELQQFSSINEQSDIKKTSTKHQHKNKLGRGPIILAIDTSGSMSGRPLQIAKALLMNIFNSVQKQHRKLFLITYSVHAKTLDLSSPSSICAINQFFSHRYSGGTDGEEMFSRAIDVLQSEDYKLADVLIISDFQFSLPKSDTAQKIEQERAKGTCFYGLFIDGLLGEYSHFLDRYWEISL